MIKTFKQQDVHWTVYNTKTGTCADIYPITEMFMGKHRHVGYRVDIAGETVASAIDHFKTAQAIAIKYVKGEVDYA